MANLQTAQYAGSWRKGVHVPSYISGYFDGEGCFSVALSPRSQLQVGWEVRPSVSISQNGDRAQVIEQVLHHFGCGTIRPDSGDKTVKWESRSLRDLTESVLPHFRLYPLQSGKQRDVEALDEICRKMERKEHLSVPGLTEIVELARTMNPSGSRRYNPSEIIRDLVKKKA